MRPLVSCWFEHVAAPWCAGVEQLAGSVAAAAREIGCWVIIAPTVL